MTCYLAQSCTCMEGELLKKMESYHNKSSISISNSGTCYVKLPSDCSDLMNSSLFYGLLTSEDALCKSKSGAINYRTAAETGKCLCFTW